MTQFPVLIRRVLCIWKRVENFEEKKPYNLSEIKDKMACLLPRRSNFCSTKHKFTFKVTDFLIRRD